MTVTRMGSDGTLIWWCPGCEEYHGVPVRGEHKWDWNGSMDKPTLSPSVLVNVGRANPTRHLCHIFMKDGEIQFLEDCTHHLAGQIVPLREDD